MGNDKSKNETSQNQGILLKKECVIKEIQDHSDNGYYSVITYNGDEFYILYRDPNFVKILQQIEKEKAYNFVYSNIEATPNGTWAGKIKYKKLDSILEVNIYKHTGKIKDFVDIKDVDNVYQNYYEVVLYNSQIELNESFARLLIEKKRTNLLNRNVEYEFLISLFADKNKFIVRNVNLTNPGNS